MLPIVLRIKSKLLIMTLKPYKWPLGALHLIYVSFSPHSLLIAPKILFPHPPLHLLFPLLELYLGPAALPPLHTGSFSVFRS